MNFNKTLDSSHSTDQSDNEIKENTRRICKVVNKYSNNTKIKTKQQQFEIQLMKKFQNMVELQNQNKYDKINILNNPNFIQKIEEYRSQLKNEEDELKINQYFDSIFNQYESQQSKESNLKVQFRKNQGLIKQLYQMKEKRKKKEIQNKQDNYNQFVNRMNDFYHKGIDHSDKQDLELMDISDQNVKLEKQLDVIDKEQEIQDKRNQFLKTQKTINNASQRMSFFDVVAQKSMLKEQIGKEYNDNQSVQKEFIQRMKRLQFKNGTISGQLQTNKMLKGVNLQTDDNLAVIMKVDRNFKNQIDKDNKELSQKKKNHILEKHKIIRHQRCSSTNDLVINKNDHKIKSAAQRVIDEQIIAKKIKNSQTYNSDYNIKSLVNSLQGQTYITSLKKTEQVDPVIEITEHSNPDLYQNTKSDSEQEEMVFNKDDSLDYMEYYKQKSTEKKENHNILNDFRRDKKSNLNKQLIQSVFDCNQSLLKEIESFKQKNNKEIQSLVKDINRNINKQINSQRYNNDILKTQAQMFIRKDKEDNVLKYLNKHQNQYITPQQRKVGMLKLRK